MSTNMHANLYQDMSDSFYASDTGLYLDSASNA